MWLVGTVALKVARISIHHYEGPHCGLVGPQSRWEGPQVHYASRRTLCEGAQVHYAAPGSASALRHAPRANRRIVLALINVHKECHKINMAYCNSMKE